MKYIYAFSLPLLAVLLAGCISPIEADEKPEPPPIPIPRDDSQQQFSGAAVTIHVPEAAWQFVAKYVRSNSITIRDEIRIDDLAKDNHTRIVIPAGTTGDITIDEDRAIIEFRRPYPQGRWWGLQADVHSAILTPDGAGLARTRLRDFKFRWSDEPELESPDLTKGVDGSTAPPARDRDGSQSSTPVRREVVVISPAGWRCPACELAVSSIEALGVRVVRKSEDGHQSYPVVTVGGKPVAGLASDGYWRVGRDDVEVAKWAK